MTWTVADDENQVVHVRAILNLAHDRHELTKLIAALQKRYDESSPQKETEQ